MVLEYKTRPNKLDLGPKHFRSSPGLGPTKNSLFHSAWRLFQKDFLKYLLYIMQFAEMTNWWLGCGSVGRVLV